MARKRPPNEQEVPLAGVMAEFRIALQEEIEAARRHEASSAVSLVNGRRIVQIGGSYQYSFDVENILNLPGDTPGDLYVPGSSPLEVVVVSVDGMTITLSVTTDLGTFVPSARLQSNLAHLMRKLIERIEGLATKPNPVGDRILGESPVTGTALPLAEVRQVNHGKEKRDCLNEQQLAALASSLGRDTTFIWGPPGTGKTRTIGAIGEQLYQRARSLLLVSHTNAAVDEAVIRIADVINPDDLSKGRVLRVGDPRDQRLNDEKYKNILLKTHTDRRSGELAARRDACQAEKRTAVGEVIRLSQLIDLIEWVQGAEQDIAGMSRETCEITELGAAHKNARAEQEALRSQSAQLASAAEAARHVKCGLVRITVLDKQIGDASEIIARAQADLATLEGMQRGGEREIDKASPVASLVRRLRHALGAGHTKQKSLSSQSPRWSTAHQAACYAKARLGRIEELDGKIVEGKSVLDATEAKLAAGNANLAAAQNLLNETMSVSWLTRQWRGLPAPDRQRQEVDRLTQGRDSLQAKHAIAREALTTLTEKRSRFVAEVEAFRLKHSADPDEVLARVKQHSRMLNVIEAWIDVLRKHVEAMEPIAALEAERERLATEVASFRSNHAAEPEEVIAKAEHHDAQLAEVARKVDHLRHECARRRASLENTLVRRLSALRDWGLSDAEATDIDGMLHAIRKAYDEAKSRVAGQDLSSLNRQREHLHTSIRALDAEIQGIEESLKRVEELVIADATVVATTLTRAYLRDSIQSRRFDTVILDEASMAPIPALWVAASTATANAVVVGDFRQLPPIVISKKDLPLKWLGKDIFEVAKLLDLESTEPRVDLLEQHRMHPEISAIPNALVYSHKLRDAADMDRQDEEKLASWYRADWGHDSPVLLVDTGSVGAWVTSVPRGTRASRVNFLSATICVDIAEQLLRTDRPEPRKRRRIIIACPYSPHAKLLQLLIREQGLSGDVVAGTVHSFQGSEEDAVVLDLVNDEPHWRVGMFMPKHDDVTLRLLNVALTRARRRLIVVGDFEYIQKLAKKAFLGKDLVPFLLDHYPRVDAKDVVPVGLAARAAQAQSAVVGGSVEPDADRLVVTQERFYAVLRDDMAKARGRIVVFSPFITPDRLGELQAQLRAAVERGVRVYVVTKALSEREASLSAYRNLEQALKSWGIVVVHKCRMHEKVVLLDDDILWTGSLNALSFKDTQEIMHRWRSKKLVAECAKLLRLDELLNAYKDGIPSCPICGSEVVASEGADDPFYWTCVEKDCYSRSVDQPPLKDGVIVCANCGGRVEFGEWGNEPVWRCTSNPRHRQKIARTHLRLPKMRYLVPERELSSLERKLGSGAPRKRPADGGDGQARLFEL